MTLCRAARVAALLVFSAAAALAQPAAPPPNHPSTGAPDVPAGDATVIGRLVHPRRPAAVANVDILLYALSTDGSAGLRQGKTDAQGHFRFEKVSNAPEVVYLVGARPGEIPFGTRFTFARGEREHRVELALSDSTADSSAVAAKGLEIRVERGCTHLRVSHRHEIANRGNRVVFVPEPERAKAAPIFEVELPEQADGFEAIAGGDGITRDGRRVRFWGPLYPGEQSVEFGYGLPLATSGFALGFPSGAPAVAVLAPKGAVDVSSPALRSAPERAIEEERFIVLKGAAIAAGGSLALAVTSAPSAPSPLRTTRAELWLELDDAALEVEERIEVVAEGEGAPLKSPAVPLMCIPLPPDTGELRFSSETFSAGLRRDPSGDVAIHGPLPRGTSLLALSYRLPATSDGASLEAGFDRELPLLSVLVADNGVIAETQRLHRRKSARAGDRNYLHLEAFSVEPGESIAIGLRRTAPAAVSGRAAPAGFALLAGLAAFGFLLGPLRGRGPAPQALAEPEGPALEREAIRRSLEALDEDLDTGKLSEEDHSAMRTALRARAAALLLERQVARSEPQASEGHQVGTSEPPSQPASPAPRFCSACGKGVRPGDAFCSQCGSRLSV
jgi:zinc-ribbon domain